MKRALRDMQNKKGMVSQFHLTQATDTHSPETRVASWEQARHLMKSQLSSRKKDPAHVKPPNTLVLDMRSELSMHRRVTLSLTNLPEIIHHSDILFSQLFSLPQNFDTNGENWPEKQKTDPTIPVQYANYMTAEIKREPA